MATKRRRGESWQYTIKRAGLLPQPVCLSFGSEAEGDEYVRRLEALLDRGVVPEELPRHLTRGRFCHSPWAAGQAHVRKQIRLVPKS